MNIQETRKKVVDKLTKEGVVNNTILKSLDSTKSVRHMESISLKILKRKKRLLELVRKLNEENIRLWFDTKIILCHLDGKGYNRINKKADGIFSFLNRKRKTLDIVNKNKNKFPQRLIRAIEKCTDKVDLERILDEVPPMLLVKLRLKKLKMSGSISTKKSIRAISTPMRD